MGHIHSVSAIFYPIAGLLGYLIGSFPTAYIVVRQLTGQDIRTLGSGNVGATNVKRTVGFRPFLLVLILDVLKGALPVALARQLFPGADWLHVLVGFSTVLGHSRSIFLGFSGGKSAATGLGSMLGLSFFAMLTLGLIAYAVTRLSGFVSLGSITASVLAPVALYCVGAPTPYIIYAGIAGFYVILLHRANIERLMKGTENRI